MSVKPLVCVREKEVWFGSVHVEGYLTNGVSAVDDGNDLLVSTNVDTLLPANSKLKR